MTKLMNGSKITKLSLNVILSKSWFSITKVDDFYFLGLTLDIQLNWKKHSENISNKEQKFLNNRYRLKLVLSINIMLYKTLLLPHINYCLMTWGFHRHRIDQL